MHPRVQEGQEVLTLVHNTLMNMLATTNIIIILILLLSAIESTYCYLAVLTSSPIQPSPLQLISSPRRLQQVELSDFDCVNASSLDDCLLPDYYCGSNFTDGVCQLCKYRFLTFLRILSPT